MWTVDMVGKKEPFWLPEQGRYMMNMMQRWVRTTETIQGTQVLDLSSVLVQSLPSCVVTSLLGHSSGMIKPNFQVCHEA